MPHERTTTVYTFDELSDRAKERARDWYRSVANDDFSSCGAESTIEDAARMADLLGINLRNRRVRLMNGGTRLEPEVYWSGFSSQGDGACFVGTYSYKPGSVKAIAAEAPPGDDAAHKQNNELNRIARDLAELQRPHFYKLSASVRHTGHYSHEHSTTIDVDCECASCQRGNNVDGKARDENVADLLRDFMRWIYRALEAEWIYQNSNEQVDDMIRANDYEFNEDGTRA